VRYAAELGYDVTVVKDATADYSDEMMHAALDINMPNYASANRQYGRNRCRNRRDVNPKPGTGNFAREPAAADAVGVIG